MSLSTLRPAMVASVSELRDAKDLPVLEWHYKQPCEWKDNCVINIKPLIADKNKRLNFVSGLVECDKSGYVFSASGEVAGNRLSLSALGREIVTYAVTINEGYIDVSHL